MSLYYRYGKELKENNLVKNIFYFYMKNFGVVVNYQLKILVENAYRNLKNYKKFGVVTGINENFGPESFEPPGCKTVSKFYFSRLF